MTNQFNAPPPPKPPLKLYRFKELTTPNLTGKSLVKGLIDQETLVLMVGPPGCRKTFAAIDLSLHLGLGWQWFGHRVRRCRVVYVAAEAGNSIRNRIAAFALEKLDARDDEPTFSAITSPVDLCHLNQGDVERVVSAIKATVPDDGLPLVVVIDTLSRVLAGGRENMPEDMSAFVMACDRLRDLLKCTVIVVHHTGKDETKGSRGHSSLICAVDTEITFAKYDTVSTATLTKQRDGREGTQFTFSLKSVQLGPDQDGDEVTSCVVVPEENRFGKVKSKPPKMTNRQKDMVAVLVEAVQQHGEDVGVGHKAVTLDQWHEKAKSSNRFGTDEQLRSAWSRVRRDLIEKGLVGYQEDITVGGWVWVTDDNVISLTMGRARAAS